MLFISLLLLLFCSRQARAGTEVSLQLSIVAISILPHRRDWQTLVGEGLFARGGNLVTLSLIETEDVHVHKMFRKLLLNLLHPRMFVFSNSEFLYFVHCVFRLIDTQQWRVMRGFWRARQKSVGCISPHAWKLPLIMAVCILVYSLPLSLAVSVEPLTGPRKLITWTMN